MHINRRFALALASIFTSTSLAHADVATWNAASGDWSNPANWVLNVPPNAPDAAALFAGPPAVITVSSPITLGSLYFDGNSSLTFNASSSGSLTFSSIESPASIFVGPALGEITVHTPLHLASDLTISHYGANHLIFQGPISGAANLTLDGPGTVNLRGDNVNWIHGTITLARGVLTSASGSITSYGNPTSGTIVVNAGASLNVTSLTPGAFSTFSKTLVLAGAGTSTSAGAINLANGTVFLSGPITLASTATLFTNTSTVLHLGNASASSPATLSGLGTLIKSGGGTLQLNLAAAHTGGTILSQGTLLLGTAGSLVNTGSLTVNSGASFSLSKPAGTNPAQNGLSPNSLILAGGTLAVPADVSLQNLFAPSSFGQILLQSAGPFTSGGSNIIDLSNLAPGRTLRIGATVSSTLTSALLLIPNANTHTLHFGGGTGSGTLTIQSVITDHGAPTNIQFASGSQAFLVSGSSNYSGFTAIDSALRVSANHAQAFGTNAGATFQNAGTLTINASMAEPFIINNGILVLNASTSGAIVVNAGTATLNAGSAGGTGPITLAGGLLTLGSSWAQTITVSGGSLTASANVSTPLHITGGLVTLDNNYAGPITLSGGILRKPNANSIPTGSLTLNGGTLHLLQGSDFSPSMLHPASTGGVLAIEGGPRTLNSPTFTLDFSAIPGGAGISLASLTNATLASNMILKPDALSQTLRFGAPGATGTLTLANSILDYDAVRTHLAIAAPSTIVLPTRNFYAGITTISGTVLVNHPQGLGVGTDSDVDATIVNPGGKLITGPTVTLATEKVIAYGGTLSLLTGGAVQINGPATLLGTYSGPISGTGDFFTNAALILSGTNSFSGNLTILSGGSVSVSTPTGLGAPSGSTFINPGGTLTISAASQEDIVQSGGTFNASAPFHGTLSVSAGVANINVPGTALITMTGGSLNLNGAGTHTISAIDARIRFNDKINSLQGVITANNSVLTAVPSSSGEVHMDAPVQILTAGTITASQVSNTSLTFHSPVVVNANLTIGTSLDSGTVNFLAPFTMVGNLNSSATVAFNSLESSGNITHQGANFIVNQNFHHVGSVLLNRGEMVLGGSADVDGTLRLNSGRLTVAGAASLKKLVFDGGTLGGNGSLTLDSTRIDLPFGTIDFTGTFVGIDSIHKVPGGSNATIARLPASFMGSVHVDQGQLRILSSFTGSSNTFHVAASDAELSFQTGTYSNPIMLHNSKGVDGAGAIAAAFATFGSDVTILGNIDLGDVGSTLGMKSSGGSPNYLSLLGTLTGGGLTIKSGFNGVQIMGNAAQTGPTFIGTPGHNPLVTISINGMISSHGRIYVSSGASLHVVNQIISLPDRIPDSTEIVLTRGTFALHSADQMSSSETIGTVISAAGLNTIMASSDFAGSPLALTINQIVRSKGSIVSLGKGFYGTLGGNLPADPRIFITSQPQTNFMGAGFVSDSRDWVAYTANGIWLYTPSDYHVGPAAGWNVNSNVLITNNVMLSSDRTVNSLKLEFEPLAAINLGGHVLNLLSGGLIISGATISGAAGSVLTAGGTAPAELFLHRALTGSSVNVAIRDNPGPDGLYAASPGGSEDSDNGQVSLVVSGFALHLAGNNSYSGETYINSAILFIDTPGAVSGSALFINQGAYTVNGIFTASPGPISLYNGTLDGFGSIQTTVINITSGVISAKLIGAPDINKTSDGSADFIAQEVYNGAVNLTEGLLNLSGSTLTNTHMQNATLALGTNSTVQGSISFAGTSTISAGTYALAFSSVQVAEGATLAASGTVTINGPVDVFTDSSNPTRHLNLISKHRVTIASGQHHLNTLTAGTVTVNLNALLSATSFSASTLNINGTLALPPQPTRLTSVANVITIAGTANAWTGTLDLGNANLILQTTDKSAAIAQLVNQINSGKNNGTWTGKGITSTTAAANSTNYAVGIFDNATLQLTTFANQPVNENSLILSLARYGDTNFDQIIDINDLGNLANNWQQPAQTWSRGDFNMDGFVDIEDLGILASNWQQTSQFPLQSFSSFSVPRSAFPSTNIPEPTTGGLALLAAALPLLRRKRNPTHHR